MVPDWEKRFQEGQTPWQRKKLNPALVTWLSDGTLKPCRILIPGVGGCLEAAELAKRGFDVVGLDLSATAIKNQREHLASLGLEAEFYVGDMFDWRTENPFDVVYEQTCLCAIEPKQRLAFEVKIRDWLKDDGCLFALFMQTGKRGGPPYDCDLDAMEKLFPSSSWLWEEETQQRADFHALGSYELGRILKKL